RGSRRTRAYSPTVGGPERLMEVRNEDEGAEVCARLRAAGIRCAVEPLPDSESCAAIWGQRAGTVLMVLVEESDIDRAREVVREHQREASDRGVSVGEAEPAGGDASGVGAGFEAVCECDWTGPIRDTSDEALADARAHSANVAPDVVPAPHG